eukprot:125459-Chlamydomonas_euryale.AAC.1
MPGALAATAAAAAATAASVTPPKTVAPAAAPTAWRRCVAWRAAVCVCLGQPRVCMLHGPASCLHGQHAW